MHPTIYLDYASTTPVDPAVAKVMMDCLTLDGNFANPASRSHRPGWMAEEAVDIARHQIADAVNADAREIIFTSGATESNNLAIKGAVDAIAQENKHIITVATEHKAIIDVFEYLTTKGVEVTYLKPAKDGLVSVSQLEEAIRPHTVLVSIMHVNNETGVIQDIERLGAVCRDHNILFHCDAAQSTGKCDIDLSTMPVDLMSFSAHKTYGPKGIGALFIRRKPKVQIIAQMHGGAHERGFRSGTLPTHQIVGMGKAFEIAAQERLHEQARIGQLRDTLWESVRHLPDIRLNGHASRRVANTLNISFGQLDSQQLMPALMPLAVSSGSACTSATMTPSHVLTAMGVDQVHAHSAIRISLGRFSTNEEVDFAANHIVDVVSKLTAL
ncbi:IscS subfamily cysteine desulfurase [Alteromonas sediminis]|uniref:cysteine desulfurase n=1 Tax=Alteromonas sediminis TaxID=2259342 RepID=A0A3N5XXU4_9ALTE|nr:IscS subfamily cysteine desulfurase [Alteromonas sediminis]RPJ65672.1 IscS subfamily cysteine desulfurase [Alteromonas sediminis]